MSQRSQTKPLKPTASKGSRYRRVSASGRLKEMMMGERVKHTEGPWEYIPSNEHHGPYVKNGWGAGDICDCYTMTNPDSPSIRNGGESKPVPFQGDEADANARLISAAPDMLEALRRADQFITNGIELGFIRLPDAETPDPAHETPGIIRAAIAKATEATP